MPRSSSICAFRCAKTGSDRQSQGCQGHQLTVAVLERERHAGLIEEIRAPVTGRNLFSMVRWPQRSRRDLDLRAAADQPSAAAAATTTTRRSLEADNSQPAGHRPPPDSAHRRPGSGTVAARRRASLLANGTGCTPQAHRPRGAKPSTAERDPRTAGQAPRLEGRTRCRPGGEPPTHGSTQYDAAGNAFDGRHGTIQHAGRPC
jgi:hypothetical protein